MENIINYYENYAGSYINKFPVIVSEIRRDNQKMFGDAIDNIL